MLFFCDGASAWDDPFMTTVFLLEVAEFDELYRFACFLGHAVKLQAVEVNVRDWSVCQEWHFPIKYLNFPCKLLTVALAELKCG